MINQKTFVWTEKRFCSTKGCIEEAKYHFKTGIVILFACEKHNEETRKLLQKILRKE